MNLGTRLNAKFWGGRTIWLLLSAGMGAEPNVATKAAAPVLLVQVDPRVELVSLIFRLAGNREYSQCRVGSYSADADRQFGSFGNHRAVTLAKALRGRRGVSYDACMSLAVHLRSVEDLELRVPIEPWPDGLDKRWTATDLKEFLSAAKSFVQESKFLEFQGQQRALYKTTESRLRDLMQREAHLEWFKEYFGERPGANFAVVPGLFNGGSCYGSHCRETKGKESLYCILGVWKTDSAGLPEFTKDMLETVVHEFAHSYANPVIDRHAMELKTAAAKLYQPVATKMSSQAYGNGQTMLRESLTRVCQVRYSFRYEGTAAGNKAIREHKSRGFLWMAELSELMADYEAHRDRYPTLDSFAPRLVEFFNGYSKNFALQQAEIDAKRPKVVSMTPASDTYDTFRSAEGVPLEPVTVHFETAR